MYSVLSPGLGDFVLSQGEAALDHFGFLRTIGLHLFAVVPHVQGPWLHRRGVQHAALRDLPFEVLGLSVLNASCWPVTSPNCWVSSTFCAVSSLVRLVQGIDGDHVAFHDLP